MMKHPALASLALVVALSGCANSGMNMNDAAQMASVINAATPNSGTSATRNTVTELLNVFAGTPVTGQQAVGGTAALLGLAQNQLGGSQYTQLAQQVPGLQQLTGSNAVSQLNALGMLSGQGNQQSLLGAALGNTGTQNGVNQAFSALGMDTSMVGVFSQLLLQYFGAEGVSAPLLQSLAGVWGAQG